MHIYTPLVQYRISMRLQYCPRDVQTIYVPWAIQDFHASIRPLGHIGFTCIYTPLGPYRIFMHLYVPWAIQDLHASIRPQGASGGQYGLIFFANFILYEGCITVGGVYIAIQSTLSSHFHSCFTCYPTNLIFKHYISDWSGQVDDDQEPKTIQTLATVNLRLL